MTTDRPTDRDEGLEAAGTDVAEAEAAPDEPAEASKQADEIDIYELLGVTPDASVALARELYWVKMERYRAAQRRGEPDARAAIDDLNRALNIILDDRRRAEYDRTRERQPAAAVRTAASGFERARRLRATAVLLVLALAAGGAAAGWFVAESTLLVALSIAGGIAVLLGIAIFWRLDAVGGRNPFTLLGLGESASVSDVDLAYETQVQELLGRVKDDASVIPRLEVLDQAYFHALRALARREGVEAAPVAAAGGRLERPRGWLGRAAAAAGRALLDVLVLVGSALGVLLLTLARWIGRLLGRWGASAGRRIRHSTALAVRWGAVQLSELSQRIWGADEEPLPPVDLDVERRLERGFRRIAERSATGNGNGDSTVEPVSPGETAARSAEAEGEPEPERLEAYVVLEAAVGERRVPVRQAPLRIGTGEQCDLSLPAEEGVAEEHALVWQHGDAVLLHVIARGVDAVVNGRSMTWASLEDGDVVRLGDVALRVDVRERAAH